MTDDVKTIIVRKNRKRAFGALVIILFFVPISGLLVYLGLYPGRPDVSWSLVLFGLVGVALFGGSAILILRTLRAPWHLALSPAHMGLYTPAYDLEIPWERIEQIGVGTVNRRDGCVLVFDDVTEVVQRARFHHSVSDPNAVTNAGMMQARMAENEAAWGYHLAIPGRILEMGPQELATLLTKARTGQLWQEQEGGA